jgi:hypothetical protein
MSSPVQAEQTGTEIPNARALGQVGRAGLIVAMLWAVSSEIYYALVSAFDPPSGYDDRPLLFATYYLGWAILAFWIFRNSVAETLQSRMILREAFAMLPILLVFGGFVVFVLPLLPQVSERLAPDDTPEFMFASAWYYLPKSADILFQQVLVAALIFAAARAGFALWQIGIGLAGAFGLFHLSLALDGFIPLYVARFTLAATAFGTLLPYLYLRVRRGFRWAYGLHWGFYALDATLTHFLLAPPPWAQT